MQSAAAITQKNVGDEARTTKCKANNVMCNYCGRKGHLERVCNQKKREANLNNGKTRTFGNRVQLVDQDGTGGDDNMVLNVNGSSDDAKPFYMEGFINSNKFKIMIDTGSPVTILALDEAKRIMKRDKLQVRPMIEGDRYVDFNGKPLQLLGYVFCELQVDESYVREARILIAQNGSKSIIGREWLSTLRNKLEPEQGKLIVNSIEKELCEETKQLVKEIPAMFERQGKIKNYQVKINLKPNAKITQQKGRRVPIQLQESLDAKVNRSLKEGHIEKIDETKDDVFIQPTVITVKKDRSVKIALDARALNQEIDKDKNQMPNLDSLPDMVAEKLDTK